MMLQMNIDRFHNLNFILSVGCENRGVLTAIGTDLRIGVKFKTQVFMGKSYR